MAGLIIAIISLGLITVPYIWYPLFHVTRRYNQPFFPVPEDLPMVSIVFAAYNEVNTLQSTLENMTSVQYPHDKLEILIGSDLSDDGTDELVRDWSKDYPFIQLHVNSVRSGKSATINRLVEMAKGEVIVATDANINFNKKTLLELVSPLHSGYDAVGGTLVYGEVPSEVKTATSEAAYLNLENRIRFSESLRYGFCLGMEGGLYALNKENWTPIPPNTFMEDFFQTAALIIQGKRIFFNTRALGYEDVSINIGEEYKRKIRISTGNFQNLKRFAPYVLKQPWPFGYSFVSHKILRWITPHLYILAIIALMFSGHLVLGILLTAIPLAAFLLLWINIPSSLAYFCAMNLALLVGHYKFLTGIKSSVWQPTKRNQYES